MKEDREFRPNRMIPGTACLVVCLAALLPMLGGCSLPGKEQGPRTQSYVLLGNQSGRLMAYTDAKPCLSIRLDRASAAPGFSTNRMAYTEQTSRLDYFAYHQWIDSPARMLTSLMAQSLEASGMFGAVLTRSPEIRTDLRLDTELLLLQQNFQASASAVELKIKIDLIDVANRSLISSKVFSYAITASNANPEAGVAAANEAVAVFLSEFLSFVNDAIASFDCS